MTSNRSLLVLGTSSAVPTRERGHTALLLRWEGLGLLVDCGEGTQRQLVHAGVSAATVDVLAVTHAHGDHCLGIPGLLQRRLLEGVPRPVHLVAPRGAQRVLEALLTAGFPDGPAPVVHHWVDDDGPVDLDLGRGLTLAARALDHRAPACGYRLQEDDGRRMLPARLAEAGVAGPDVGRLQRDGVLVRPGATVHLADVSVPRRGQSVAFVLDTRRCEGAEALAAGVDLLVAESTFADGEEDLAASYGHLTAGQAGALAHRSGARRLVLVHVSQRHGDVEVLADQARRAGAADVVGARDLQTVLVPPRA